MKSDDDPCDDCGHPYRAHLPVAERRSGVVSVTDRDLSDPCSLCACRGYDAVTVRASVRVVARHYRQRLARLFGR